MGCVVGPPSSLVGRADELAVLRAAWDDSARRPTLATVTGEAGIGKSTLVDLLAEQAAAAGDQVLRGACTVVCDEPITYAPVAQALRGLGTPAGLGAAAPNRAAFYESVLGALAGLRPEGARQLLVLEDLHWTDATTLELIAFLARNLPAGHLIVLTYRDDEMGADPAVRFLLDSLVADRRVRRVALARLSAEETVRLATRYLGRPPGAEQAAALVARCGGNPFIAEELLSAERLGAVPQRLQDVLLTRVARLDAAARHVVDLVAVLGRPVSQDLLDRLTGAGPAACAAAAAACVRSGILVVDAAGQHYAFRHVLSQEAVLSRLLPGERRQLHTDIARALEELPATRRSASAAAEWATHWYAGGRLTEAFGAALAAADVARDAFAHGEVWRQLGRAVELLRRGAAPPDFDEHRTVQLLADAAEAARWAGATAAAVETARAALEAAVEPTDRMRIGERLGRCLWDAGDTGGADAAYAQAARLAARLPVTTLHATIAASRGRLAMLSGHYDEAMTLAREAVRLAELTGAPAEKSRALTTLGMSDVQIGHLDGGIALLRAGAALAHECGDPEDRRRADGNLAFALLIAGHTREAAETAVRGLADARRYSPIAGTGAALVTNAVVMLRLAGRWEEADRLSADAIEEGMTEGQALLVHLARAELDMIRGRLEEARQALDTVAPLGRRGVSASIAADIALAEAEWSLHAGDLDAARERVEQALRTLDGSSELRDLARACELALRIEADRLATPHGGSPRAADRARAAALAERAAAAADGSGAPEVQAYRLTASGEFARVEQRRDVAAWALAADAWQRCGRPHEEAYARLRTAEALAARDRAAATAELRRAQLLATRLGARPLSTAVTAFARRARLSLPDTPASAPPPGAELTARELDVLRELTHGLTNKQIAARLYLSHRTVDVHVSHVLTKLAAHNRAEAVAIAAAMQLLPDG